MDDYWRYSRSAYYSIFAVLPLLIGYEILLMFTQSSTWQVRNAADVWLRYLLQAFEIQHSHLTFVMIGLTMAAIPLVKWYLGGYPLKFSYFLGILIESFAYSLVLGIVLQFLLSNFALATITSTGTLQKLALSLGAGLFEEFIFRVVLLNILFYVLKVTFRNAIIAGIIAILTASFLFSLSHYIGNMADSFHWYSFFFRWLAGLIFTVLYFVRGFAITAYTHALYDIQVLL